MRPGAAADFNRAVALLHSFWFAQAIDGFNACSPRSVLRDRTLGHRPQPLGQSVRRPAGAAADHARPRRHPEAQTTGSPTPRDAPTSMQPPRSLPTAMPRRSAPAPWPTSRPWRARPAIPGRYGGAHLLCARGEPDGSDHRQDVCAAAESGGDSGAAVQGTSDASRSRALHHSRLRSSSARREGAGRGAPLCVAGTGRPARAPHAVAHVHARRALEGIDRDQSPVGRSGEEGEATAEELHALDYQAYAYLQIGRIGGATSSRARRCAAAARLDAIAIGVAAPGVAGLYAAAAIPARYALERGAWAEAAALRLASTTFPYTEAITHFARALGAARSGNPRAAAPDVERLAALRDTLKTMHDAYWAEQVDIQRQIAIAWVTLPGATGAGIEQLRAAAETEDDTDKSAVSPGPLAPARELLGYMLLDAAGRPKRSLSSKRPSAKNPTVSSGFTARAAPPRQPANARRAIAFYKQLLQVASEADTNRPELFQARLFAG